MALPRPSLLLLLSGCILIQTSFAFQASSAFSSSAGRALMTPRSRAACLPALQMSEKTPPQLRGEKSKNILAKAASTMAALSISFAAPSPSKAASVTQSADGTAFVMKDEKGKVSVEAIAAGGAVAVVVGGLALKGKKGEGEDLKELELRLMELKTAKRELRLAKKRLEEEGTGSLNKASALLDDIWTQLDPKKKETRQAAVDPLEKDVEELAATAAQADIAVLTLLGSLSGAAAKKGEEMAAAVEKEIKAHEQAEAASNVKAAQEAAAAEAAKEEAAEKEAKAKAEAEAKAKAAEAEREKKSAAEEAAKKQQEAAREQEAQAKKKAEEEKKAAEAKKKAEEEAAKKKEAEAKAAAEAAKKKEAEAKAKAEAEAAAAKEKAKKEAERKAKEEEEAAAAKAKEEESARASKTTKLDELLKERKSPQSPKPSLPKDTSKAQTPSNNQKIDLVPLDDFDKVKEVLKAESPYSQNKSPWDA
eukprot:CAMPEP_0181332068 /NCGR_PEP_ID=MMETSP1101-20121128/24871_1 /TAXON_ID=46948 /ORGANISM="Rhodomonas abbreviata, Strain Caron Lab Isolate" /LENGTH=476 /DNA_ID=CAMNT_0023441637 /DNA_START=15 /DNA_END=1445 /DNA_ORIENTATION=-